MGEPWLLPRLGVRNFGYFEMKGNSRYNSGMFLVTTFYKFVRLEPAVVEELRGKLFSAASERAIEGLILLGSEGVNGSIAGAHEHIEAMQGLLRAQPAFSDILFKSSESTSRPFRRFKIEVREEIVTLDKPEIFPTEEQSHLSPEQWQRILEEEEVLLLDIRNEYETRVGKFKGALDPGLQRFSEFPHYVAKANLPKDKKILMYCTGGIRCEKAVIEMRIQGYSNVFQLEGGILNYLAQYPEKSFEGECYVFDNRLAVDQSLAPSRRYRLCPHCGDPAEIRVTCKNCSKPAVICEKCITRTDRCSCSKNCAYHIRRIAA